MCLFLQNSRISLFFEQKMEVYTGSPADVQEDERGFMLSYVGQCRDYLSGMPGGLPPDLVLKTVRIMQEWIFMEKSPANQIL